MHTRKPAQIWRYFYALACGKQIVHVLHVSKTGGTALKAAIRGHLNTETAAIFLHEHTFRLRDVAVGHKAVIFFRHPLQRFVSAFYSRQRCGRPRYETPWTPAEVIAFARFGTPNQLACAISADDSNVREAAHSAMTGISLVKDSFFDWVESEAYFEERRADILFIGSQENLPRDFVILIDVLGLPSNLTLPTDARSSHRNPEGLNTGLDVLAQANLTSWYARDIEFLSRLQRT